MAPRNPEVRLVYSTGGEAPPAGVAAPEKPQAPGSGIRLRLERRASGRVVTAVTGLPGSPQELAELARHLKSVCSAGGSLNDRRLELQGDQREKVEAALAGRGLHSRRAGG